MCIITVKMKHYRAKPSAQLSKYLQDDIKHTVMKLESLNWSNHKNVHCIYTYASAIAQCVRNLPAGQSRADITS